MRERVFEAIVVGSVDVGESNRILRLLTAELGRISVIGRGIRSSRKRGGNGLDVGSRVRANLRAGRGDLARLGAVERLSGAQRARDDLAVLTLLLYACELCAGLAPENAPAPKLFGLLGHTLGLLEDARPPLGCVRMALEAKALTFAGLTPVLVHCAACGEPLDDEARFDPEHGGAIHPRCGSGEVVRRDVLVELEALRRLPMGEVKGRAWRHGSRWLLARFAEYHLGKPLRSRSMLETLEEM